MKTKFLAFAIFSLASLPIASCAQGAIRGAEERAAAGDRAVGANRGRGRRNRSAAAGTVGGILGAEECPRFRECVVHERRPSFRYNEELRVGAVLPARGVTLHEVPRECGVRPGYRYAAVNDFPVIVEPRSIVEIVE